MNDERILELLRERGRAPIPADLRFTITSAIADAPQHGRSSFAQLIPPAAAVTAAAVVTVIAILISSGVAVGPAPEPTTTPTASPSATAVSTPTADVAPHGSLLDPGDSTTVSITSPDGTEGVIILERGDDTGGYASLRVPGSEAHYFVELHAIYELGVAPELAQWGAVDWRVETPDGTAVGELVAVEERPGIGTWPGATVPEERYEGWIVFALDRETAAVELDLVYAPPGVTQQLRIPLRQPRPAPAPAAAAPTPTPVAEMRFVSKPGLPFTVLESLEADALFADPDICTNPDGGYTVSFPEDWYTNSDIGDVPACTWFSPTLFEATPDGSMPPEIAIEILVIDGAVGFIWVDLFFDEVTVGTRDGVRRETGRTKDVTTPTSTFDYSYLITVGGDPVEGRKIWAFTGTDYGGDYELNRAVLDRIMASLRFDAPQE